MSNLDKSQKKAAESFFGPILVCAGPGSGKTKILIEKISNLIKKGIREENILAVTFTNKAATEMKNRLTEVVESKKNLEHLFVGTIHSLCLEILRAEEKKEILILDERDQMEIVKDLRGKLERKIKTSTRNILSMFSNYKCGRKEVLLKGFEEIFRLYQQYLKENALCDYDDLLLEVVKLLKSNEQVRKRYQQRYKHVLVDEYQDINEVQAELIYILAEPQKNLFVIGDADQAIYSFRGANLGIFLRFTKIFSEAKQVNLEKNYRSIESIVKASSSLIRNNTKRLGINLSGVKKGDFKVQIVKCGSERDESKFISTEIEKIVGGTMLLHIDSGLLKQGDEMFEESQFDDFAVLYRKNSFAKYLEHEFLHKGIPYQIVGVNNFWKKEEVMDIMAVLRCIFSNDELTSRRIRKLGLKLSELKKALLKSGQNVAEIIELSRIKEFYDGDSEVVGNIDEILRIINEIEYGSIPELVSKLALQFKETYIDKRANCVKLMTLHQAKGLEFKNIFIAGVEEGFIPLLRDNWTSDELEEERRLLYVGMTRAKERLYITSAKNRQIWGRREKREPSRFLGEIDENVVDKKAFSTKRRKKDQMKFF